MINKVRVSGQAYNRTALGIGKAYLRMHPSATLEDLNKAFPKASLNIWAGSDTIFMDVKESPKLKVSKKYGKDFNFKNLFFTEREAVFQLNDGRKVVMFSKWTEQDFLKLVEHAKQYAIEVVRFEQREWGGKKGWYELECLGDYDFPESQAEKRKPKLWAWLSLAVLPAGVVLFVLLPKKEISIVEKEIIVSDTVGEERIVKDTIIIRDTVFVRDTIIIRDTVYIGNFISPLQRGNYIDTPQRRTILNPRQRGNNITPPQQGNNTNPNNPQNPIIR